MLLEARGTTAHATNLPRRRLASAVTVALLIGACARNGLEPRADAPDTVLDGLIQPLTYDQVARHAAGDETFTDHVFTAQEGLGPVFVAPSCGTCHANNDGRGSPFTTLTRFGQNDSSGNHFLDRGGPQLQNRALPGFQPEQLPAGAPSAKFTPPIVTGLGFLDAVDDTTILALAAANAGNPDGVRGHPNWCAIPSYVTPRAGAVVQNGMYMCRFGRKALTYDLLQQVVTAFNQDMGITSSFDPIDVYTRQPIDPEVSDDVVRDVVFYLQTLKAPIQRDPTDPTVVQGWQTFADIGCATCHRQTLRTGYSSIPALSYQEFHPLTDLLVHDMGPGLDDGYTENTAKTSEWRTPPLWGLGLTQNSQGGQVYLLHDGRARSIEDAITRHGGEATAARNRFVDLSPALKAALLAYLRSL